MQAGHQPALRVPLRGVEVAAVQQQQDLNIHQRRRRRAARRCFKMSGCQATPVSRLFLATRTTRALTGVVVRAFAGMWSRWAHDSSSSLRTACCSSEYGAHLIVWPVILLFHQSHSHLPIGHDNTPSLMTLERHYRSIDARRPSSAISSYAHDMLIWRHLWKLRTLQKGRTGWRAGRYYWSPGSRGRPQCCGAFVRRDSGQ